jgi:predicted PurR-regulated permease PerM
MTLDFIRTLEHYIWNLGFNIALLGSVLLLATTVAGFTLFVMRTFIEHLSQVIKQYEQMRDAVRELRSKIFSS